MRHGSSGTLPTIDPALRSHQKVCVWDCSRPEFSVNIRFRLILSPVLDVLQGRDRLFRTGRPSHRSSCPARYGDPGGSPDRNPGKDRPRDRATRKFHGRPSADSPMDDRSPVTGPMPSRCPCRTGSGTSRRSGAGDGRRSRYAPYSNIRNRFAPDDAADSRACPTPSGSRVDLRAIAAADGHPRPATGRAGSESAAPCLKKGRGP